MSVGPVKICNQALYKIGEKDKLTSWPDPSTNGIICYEFFDDIRDVTLESEDWKCARKSAKLAQLDESPALDEYDYQYAWPNDCILPRIVCNVNGTKLTVKWEVEGRNILCGEDKVYLKYTKREIDLSKWTPTLINVFVLRMAIALVVPIGKSRGILQNLALELTDLVIPQAELSNARISYVSDEEGDPLATGAGR